MLERWALCLRLTLRSLSGARKEQQLEDALASRDVIGQAKGLLMARQDITSDQAFDALRRASQRLNVKLRDVADDMVATNDISAEVRAKHSKPIS